MRFLFLLALALLPACAQTDPKADPGNEIHIVWNRIEDPHAACEGVSGRREFFKILGCSKWREAPDRRECVIYAPAPRDERDKERFATLGHEMLHCFDGNWHDRWGRMTPQESQAVAGASRKRAGAAAEANE